MTNSSDSILEIRRELMKKAENLAIDFLEQEQGRWSALDKRAATPVDAIADLVRAGGKRIRPAFCISGYLAAGGDADGSAVVSTAAALELLHSCALIHDDVMDDSAWRRGAATVHQRHATEHRSGQWQGEPRRFGESVAILAGDLALIYADDFMAGMTPMVAEAWRDLRAELIVGQYLDVAAAARFDSDPALSRTIAQVKSGNYTIHRPMVIGAILASRPELAPLYRTYGLAVGEAFQLRDDLLDLLGDTQTLGKPAQLDFEQHKMTLLLSLAMQRDPAVRELVVEPGATADRLRDALLDSGICGEVEVHINELVALGSEAISAADLAPGWRQELIAMAHMVAYRDK
ncbi:polyprenyl synthetase family protein [Nocardia sp. NPDC051321]|uniref:polyprenyl synthetase family protein n=1 Tax=Nocardia sp. NPDC051321 TaxID=3364323 RepID=UPI00378D5E57